VSVRFDGENWIPDYSRLSPTEDLKSEHVHSNRPIHTGTPDTTVLSCLVCRCELGIMHVLLLWQSGIQVAGCSTDSEWAHPCCHPPNIVEFIYRVYRRICVAYNVSDVEYVDCRLPPVNKIENMDRGQVWSCPSDPQKCPFLWGECGPPPRHVFFCSLSLQPKRHLDAFSRFRGLHRRDQQTDTPRGVKTSVAIGRVYAMHAMWPNNYILYQTVFSFSL